MNIFFLSFVPLICAQMHCDLHLIKMILETTQLLSTCYRSLHGQRPVLKSEKLRIKSELEDPVTYKDDSWVKRCELECGKSPHKMSHYKHGSSLWLRERRANFIWLAYLGLELCNEKLVRLPNNKPHCCEPLIRWFLNNPPASHLFKEINDIHISPPYLAMADFWDCKVPHENVYESTLLSYRKYYKAKQSINVVYYKWLPVREPEWLKDHDPIDPDRLSIIKKNLNKS